MVDLTRQALAHWEAGRAVPTALQLADLAEAYGVPADFLLFGLLTIPVRMVDAIPPGVCEHLDAARRDFQTVLKTLVVQGRDPVS